MFFQRPFFSSKLLKAIENGTTSLNLIHIFQIVFIWLHLFSVMIRFPKSQINRQYCSYCSENCKLNLNSILLLQSIVCLSVYLSFNLFLLLVCLSIVSVLSNFSLQKLCTIVRNFRSREESKVTGFFVIAFSHTYTDDGLFYFILG